MRQLFKLDSIIHRVGPIYCMVASAAARREHSNRDFLCPRSRCYNPTPSCVFAVIEGRYKTLNCRFRVKIYRQIYKIQTFACVLPNLSFNDQKKMSLINEKPEPFRRLIIIIKNRTLQTCAHTQKTPSRPAVTAQLVGACHKVITSASVNVGACWRDASCVPDSVTLMRALKYQLHLYIFTKRP